MKLNKDNDINEGKISEHSREWLFNSRHALDDLILLRNSYATITSEKALVFDNESCCGECFFYKTNHSSRKDLCRELSCNSKTRDENGKYHTQVNLGGFKLIDKVEHNI
jgi:hypothetical protein